MVKGKVTVAARDTHNIITKKKRTGLRLRSGERVISAYAEPACGPGWSNRPFWVLVENREGSIRKQCLQPSEQPVDLARLYDLSALLHRMIMGGLA
jgi:hypothetical protein